MGEFTQEQLDAAISKAAADAVAKYQSDNPSTSQRDIDSAVAAAKAELKAQMEAENQLAIDREKSKQQDIAKRLKEANKKAAPAALEGLDDDAVSTLLELAPFVKGMNQEKRLAFIENASSGSFQNMLITQRDNWQTELLVPVQQENENLKAELTSLKAESVRNNREKPLKAALLEFCSSDVHAQSAGTRMMSDLFEAGLDDEGNLIAKTSGPTAGIDPETNTPFTAETAAKYLARTVSFLKKQSSTSNGGGDGKKPLSDGTDAKSVSDIVKGKTKEEKIAALEARKRARAG